MLSYLKPDYLSGDVRFFTFKGTEKKHQRIGFVNDKCRKISNTYVIVREANKKTEGCHFHALLKVHTPPKQSWFIKGVHMNLKKVGYSLTQRTNGLNLKEVLEYSGHCPELAKTLMDDLVLEKVDHQIEKCMKRDDHVENCLLYISKDMEFPAQYTDYIISNRGKMATLQ